MKKISFLAALIALISLSFTSCKEDTQPRIQKPTEFVLNQPAISNLTYILTPESTVNLEVSQANYGMGLVAVYSVQIALTEDFSNPYDLKGTYTNAKIDVAGEYLALGICELKGFKEPEDFTDDVVPVYIRVVSSIPGWPEGNIASNAVLLNMKPYFAVPVPAKLYLIGQPSGWDINNGTMYLEEPQNGIGSNVYSGVYFIKEGEFQFRFYTELGNWETNSVGAQEEDNPVEITMNNGIYEGSAVAGKGSWQISGWPGGYVKMSVDLNTRKVIFEETEAN